MSIVSSLEIKNFIGITEGYVEEAGPATDDAIDSLHLSVEKFVKTFVGKDIEQTTYGKEAYYSSGNGIINLKNYPLIYVDRVSVGTRDAIEIRNTNDWSSASVSVTSTGIRLVKDGVADETILFATYTTLGTIITAINLLSGWEAKLSSSLNNSIVSTDLVERFGASAIDENWIYLEIPEVAQSNIEVFPNEGQIIYLRGGYCGYKNNSYRYRKSDAYGSNIIYVDYTAGYSSANMPDDIKLSVKIIFKYLYDKRSQESYGVSKYTASRIKVEYETSNLPKEALDILHRYRKVRI